MKEAPGDPDTALRVSRELLDDHTERQLIRKLEDWEVPTIIRQAGLSYTAHKYDAAWDRVVNKGGERDAIWRAAFDNDLPRRERLRERKIRECVSNRETKEGVR